MSVSQHVADLIKQDIVSVMKESIGFNDEIAQQLAGDLLKKLQDKWGGQRVYIPSEKNNHQRNDLIKFEFNGSNHTQVCKKFDISLSTLYRITK